ncbi:MAG: YaeQ family protein [Solimicrobium sp.]|jgi:uncharacterized protein YaeQ|nr:YaeQ family protein [Solimicrobium sp.]
MALKSTVYKAELQLSDMDRNYYAAHSLTLARHPSETDERMMVRLLAFALNANEHLVFAKGLSDIDEPDIWLKDYTGAIKCWIEVGQPDERRLLKACGRAEQVMVYSYASNSAIWWQGMGNRMERAKNLTIWNVPVATSQALEKMVQRAMLLQCTIQDGQLWLTDGERTVQVDLVSLKEGSQ